MFALPVFTTLKPRLLIFCAFVEANPDLLVAFKTITDITEFDISLVGVGVIAISVFGWGVGEADLVIEGSVISFW